MTESDSVSSPSVDVRGRPTPALETRSLSKSYGPVSALQNVSLSLWSGEVLGLLGDNGAGKTTFVKCVSGLLRPDSGTILIDGSEETIDMAPTARALGIETVHQGLALVETLDVATNLFLNREILVRHRPLRWIKWMNKRKMYQESAQILAELGIKVPSVRHSVQRLSGGQRQAVAIGRALGWGRRIVLLDEPAAALGVEQSRHVLDLIERLSGQGVAVLFISHNMQHVVDVCHRAVVLRHGRTVGDVAISDVTPRDLVDLITGARSGADQTAHNSDIES
jgi:simple sugar transport system ATP-binding protein